MAIHIRRREFIVALGGITAAGPLASHAQERMRRIGVLVLYPENDPQGQLRATAFQQGLQQFGWVVGRNVRSISNGASETQIGYDQPPRSCCDTGRT